MSATYAYCLVQAGSAPRLTGVPRGLPQTGRPRALALEPGVWLVVADAPGAHYGPEALVRGMKDLAWVSRCAFGHERVVESFLETATTIPFRLFTLFRDDARALARMRRRRRAIKRLLSRVAGSQEWGLRVYLAREPVVRSAAARTSRALPTAGEHTSGRAFLEQKRQAALARRNALLEAVNGTKAIYTRLGSLAAETGRRDDPEAIAGSVLLDAAFLVPMARTAAFRAAVDDGTRRLRELGCRVVATGPWPPYSFVNPMRSMSCDNDTEPTNR